MEGKNSFGRQYDLPLAPVESQPREQRENLDESLPETAADLIKVKDEARYVSGKWHLWTETGGILDGKITNVFPVRGDGAMRVVLTNENGAEAVPLLARMKIRLYDESARLTKVAPDDIEPYDYVFVNGVNSKPVLVLQVLRDRTPDGGITIRFEDDDEMPPRTYYPKDERLLSFEEQTRFDIIRIPNLASAIRAV